MYFCELISASGPDCASNASKISSTLLEGTYIELWCMVRYHGNLKAVTKWWRSDGQKLLFRNVGLTDVTNTARTITTKVTLKLHASDNGVVISCLFMFKVPEIYGNNQPNVIAANNNPAHESVWNFTVSVVCKFIETESA